MFMSPLDSMCLSLRRAAARGVFAFVAAALVPLASISAQGSCHGTWVPDWHKLVSVEEFGAGARLLELRLNWPVSRLEMTGEVLVTGGNAEGPGVLMFGSMVPQPLPGRFVLLQQVAVAVPLQFDADHSTQVPLSFAGMACLLQQQRSEQVTLQAFALNLQETVPNPLMSSAALRITMGV
ncbi:MAG: hypothetical protein AAF628_14200 [Planctomycetota bacterium]